MNHDHQKSQAGIWMDHKHAIFITDEHQNGEFAIQNKVKASEHHGSKSEHTSHNASKNEIIKYFKEIANALKPYDEILLFGPGKSQEELLNFLHEDHHFNTKKITLATADHITDNQMIAQVRDFFSTS
jgi:stalled ribosome rescue protein Dom34